MNTGYQRSSASRSARRLSTSRRGKFWRETDEPKRYFANRRGARHPVRRAVDRRAPPRFNFESEKGDRDSRSVVFECFFPVSDELEIAARRRNVDLPERRRDEFLPLVEVKTENGIEFAAEKSRADRRIFGGTKKISPIFCESENAETKNNLQKEVDRKVRGYLQTRRARLKSHSL